MGKHLIRHILPFMFISLPSSISYKTIKRLLQLGFWFGFILIGSLLLGNFTGYLPALSRTLVMAVFHAILVYANLWWLLPQYVDKQRIWTYIGLLLCCIVLVMGGRMWVDEVMLSVIGRPDSPLSPYQGTSFHLLSTFFSSIVMLAISTPLHWLDDWYQKKQAQQLLENQRLEAELKFLKAQINPHFLFNTLNNIYSLTFTGSPQAAPMILQLSEMMRYMLYDSQAPRVPLSQEIAYLEHFISLQQLKTEMPQDIHFECSGDLAGLEIAPLLLVPLFENAFKHGNLEAGGWLKSSLSRTEESLRFTIQNTIGANDQKDGVGGVGLENLRQRLGLIYPKRHICSILAEKNIFSVNIQIEL